MAGTIDLPVFESLARECGFALSGVAAALPHSDAERYLHWAEAGHAGDMRYLTDHRAQKRCDPRSLLPSAQTVLCLGMLYNAPFPRTAGFDSYERGWISRYAWGEDYHHMMTERLTLLTSKLLRIEPFDYKICADTAPLLERSYARSAGLGWIGRNTCLIHQGQGSWFFLGEILTSLTLPAGQPPPDRCGTCRRCIDACPTQAIVPFENSFTVDSRRCISYFTIELRGSVPEEHRASTGTHVFGCDICQDVCPWNNKSPFSAEPSLQPAHLAPPLLELSAITEEQFREMFRDSPINRARYSGFLRNVAIAMGNSGNRDLCEPLSRMAASPDLLVSEHARWALAKLEQS